MKRQRELESNKRPKLRPRSRLMHMAGLQAFSSAEVVGEEIKSLESSNLVVEKELATLKKIYADCTKGL
jgi:hypothetical protein